jgi:hypothetical protein
VLNRDIIPLLVGYPMEWGLTLRRCHVGGPQLLNNFGRGFGRVIGKMEEDSSMMGFLFLGLHSEVVQW